MTGEALQSIINNDNITPGDRISVVFRSAPFGMTVTERGPIQTINKIGGTFRRLLDSGVLVFDDVSADGLQVRFFVEADEIILVGLVGQVGAVSLRG